MHVKTTTSGRGHPALFKQPPAKNWDPVKPPLLENLIGGSSPLSCTHTHRNTHTHTHTHTQTHTHRGKGVHAMVFLKDFVHRFLNFYTKNDWFEGTRKNMELLYF